MIPTVSLCLNNAAKDEVKYREDVEVNKPIALTALCGVQQHLYNFDVNVCGTGAGGMMQWLRAPALQTGGPKSEPPATT